MQTINYKTLRKKLDQEEDFLLVNVLSEDEYLKDHIKGSVSIPLEGEEFLTKVEKKAGSKNYKIVTYCASQDCDASRKAAGKLKEAGFTNVSAYEGGMKEWKEHRGEMAA